MLNHDELMKMWESDCRIDSNKLLETMYSHPMLHSKYLQILLDYKVRQRKLTLKFQKQRQFKTRYYNGELTKEELDSAELKQYQFKKPLKSEMETLLDADHELQMIQEQVLYLESLIQSADSIMKDIGNRYFLFKHIIEQNKFLAGV